MDMDAAAVIGGADFCCDNPCAEDGEADVEDGEADGARRAIQAGEADLPRAPARSRDLNLFTGAEYRGKRHMQWLVDRRKQLKTERALSQSVQSNQVVREAWNARVVRRGDMVGNSLDGSAGNHANEYIPSAVLRMAWRSLGKDVNERDGVEGSHHGLAIVSASSHALLRCQDVCLEDEMHSLTSTPSAIVPTIRRLYDATPSRVRFGRLQPLLQPIARYPVLGDDGRWKCVPLNEFVHTHGGSACVRFGIVDLLACGALLTYACPESMELKGFKVLAQPRIVARGNASCTYSAVEDSVKPLDSAGVRRLSTSCPFSFVVETPDDASANKRKKEQSRLDCSDNTGFVGSKCGAHQGHRVVESRQKKLVGHVHAVRVSCVAPSHQTLMQAALVKVLDGSSYHVGEPNPVFRKHNLLVVKHTLLRREMFTKGSLNASVALDIDMFPAAKTFLLAWNGDWQCNVPSFYTDGRDMSHSEAKQFMFAAAMGIDLLQSKDSSISIDDWFSTSEAAAATSLGIMCSSILQQVFDIAMPTWGAMAPPNDQPIGRSMDGASAARMRIQKKTWRAKCFLSHTEDKISCVLLTYLGVAVEHLMLRLDHMDQRPGGLWELPFPKTSPFTVCQRFLARAVQRGSQPGGVLWTVFRCFDSGTVKGSNALLDRSRTMACDMASQSWWRFLSLHELPGELAQCVNPRLSPDEQAKHLRHVWCKRSCCLDSDCTGKLMRVWPRWKDAIKSPSFRSGIVGLVHAFTMTNMSMERLLALFRRALGGRMSSSDAEAVCAKGFLMQLLVEHTRLGGDSPKHVTREQLLEDGMPLAAASASSLPCKPCSGFFFFLGHENKQRKENGIKLSGTAYREFVNVLRVRWASSDPAFRDRWRTAAHAAWAAKIADDEPDDLDVDCRDPGVYRSVVTEMGSTREPVDKKFFEVAVRSLVGAGENDPMPGFSRYAAEIRDDCTPNLFVADSGAIPDTKVFSYSITCGVAHPGTCAQRDAAYIHQARAAAAKLQHFLYKAPSGSFHLIYALSEDGDTLHSEHFYLAHVRGGGPSVSLVAPCKLSADFVAHMQCSAAGFDWEVGVTFVMRLFKFCGSLDILLCHQELRTDDTVLIADGSQRQIDAKHYNDHVVRLVREPHIIYPAIPQAKEPLSEAAKLIKAGMRKLPGAKPPPKPTIGGVRAVLPGAGGEGGSDSVGSDNTGSDDSAASVLVGDDSEPEGIPAPPHAGPRQAAAVYDYEFGFIVVNRSAGSLDVHCSACESKFDKTWRGRDNARQGHTLAQGRMLGAHFAWLAFDCGGDAEWHEGLYSEEGLPRDTRKYHRRTARETGRYADLFRLERPPRDDESDGEPLHVPHNRH